MIKDEFTRKWIIENGIPIAQEYNGEITLRALHYRLVSIGMHNTMRHYKRVIGAMTQARWDGLIRFDAFVDHDRSEIGYTNASETNVDDKISQGKTQIGLWMKNYNKNRWENQPIYPEVFIEKKALQSVFETPCRDYDVALCPCKGYPSLTYMDNARKRFENAESEGKECVILYFGDYDPSGEDIPRSIEETLWKMGIRVEVRRIALMEHQVLDWNLPPAPAKSGDSRTVNWDGLGQVELDAVEPRKLQKMVKEAIDEVFDEKLYDQLLSDEELETDQYREELKEYVNNL